ncbi:Unknown protein sequence [Pseudomonas savastanoi pv. glycinea]|uniref:Uncharacterized protein n=1 Tax=Pseudomonas savastanoi pv. glycinea TaxID=318 RepID=A0ABR5LEL5_PSESG|nr:Unknown protein sequence [Pseudomonas savastanoi pv. glycinea]
MLDRSVLHNTGPTAKLTGATAKLNEPMSAIQRGDSRRVRDLRIEAQQQIARKQTHLRLYR